MQQTFTILVDNVNEAPTSLQLSNASVPENSALGTVVGILSGSDPDAGDSLTFSIDDGTPFALANGNELVVAGALDFETRNSYDVVARVTDLGGLFLEQTLHRHGHQRQRSTHEPTTFQCHRSREQLAGTVVGILSSSDPDAGDSFSFSVGDGTPFAVADGGELVVAGALDFETQNSYDVVARVTDLGGLFLEQTFTVTVTNVNEAPTSLQLSNATVPENSSPGTVVGILSGSDPDAGDSLTFSLADGTSFDGTSFGIANGNQLVVSGTLDFETKNSYDVVARATDLGGLFIERTFTIDVADVNEAPASLHRNGDAHESMFLVFKFNLIANLETARQDAILLFAGSRR